ncbi:MAG: hypothetical protein ABI054_13895 [Planctomycetota bacterium]
MNSRRHNYTPSRVAAGLTTALLLALASISAADAPAASKLAVESDPVRSAEAFEARLYLLRRDPALDFWLKQPKGALAPPLRSIQRVCANEPFTAVLVLKHVGDTGNGTGQVSMDISVRSADGKIRRIGTGDAFKGKLPPADASLPIQKHFTLALDDKEALGAVKIVTQLRDQGSGMTLQAEAGVELVKWSYGEKPATKEDYDKWVKSYYQDQTPAESVRAYLEFADLKQDSSRDASLQFYYNILNDNLWLVPRLTERFAAGTREQQVKIAALLQATGHQDVAKSLAFKEGEDLPEIKKWLEGLTLPDPYDPWTRPSQIDQLWADFFATGRYMPARQLVRALELAPFEEACSKENPPKTSEERADALKGVIFQAARGSLESNLRQHELLKNYALFMLEAETLGEAEKTALKSLLEAQAPAKKD